MPRRLVSLRLRTASVSDKVRCALLSLHDQRLRRRILGHLQLEQVLHPHPDEAEGPHDTIIHQDVPRAQQEDHGVERRDVGLQALQATVQHLRTTTPLNSRRLFLARRDTA